MHLKNFSLIRSKDGYVLSKAYDLLPVNLVMPMDKEEFALSMHGKKTHIRKKDFLIFAEDCDISPITAQKIIAKIVSYKSQYLSMIQDSYLSLEEKQRFIALLISRLRVLEIKFLLKLEGF